MSFPYFPKVTLNNVRVFGKGEPFVLFRVFVDHVNDIQFKLYATSKMDLMAGI